MLTQDDVVRVVEQDRVTHPSVRARRGVPCVRSRRGVLGRWANVRAGARTHCLHNAVRWPLLATFDPRTRSAGQATHSLLNVPFIFVANVPYFQFRHDILY